MSDLTTASAIIDKLGGNRAVAGLTSRTAKAVSNWRAFNAFPSDTYLVLTRALAECDCAAPPSLWGMVEPNSSPAATAEASA